MKRLTSLLLALLLVASTAFIPGCTPAEEGGNAATEEAAPANDAAPAEEAPAEEGGNA